MAGRRFFVYHIILDSLGIDVLTVRNIKAAVIVFGIIHAILAGPSIVPC